MGYELYDLYYGPSSMLGALASMLIGYAVVGLLITAVMMVGLWKVFEKAGQPGWKAIIPLYNIWTLFEIVYGEGIKCLFMLIPFYNIYIMIKLYLDLAKAFDQEAGFAVGLILLSPIFLCILGFGKNYVFGGNYSASASSPRMSSGSSRANTASSGSADDARAAALERLRSRK